MRIAAFDTIAPSDPIAGLPVRLTQTSAAATRGFQIVIGSILAGAMAVPFALIATVGLEHPSARDIILARPLACLQIALGLALWTALFALPLRGVLARLNTRQIDISRDRVEVIEKGLLRTTRWREPLAAYRGIAHNIRASLSGIRHELILVHADRHRSVMLAFADRIQQSEIDRICRLLELTEIPARELYQITARKPQTQPVEGALQAA
jgi:hypothetical protein